MNEDKYFKTSSLYLAAFLFAKGLELVNIDKISDSKRAHFVLTDSPLREYLVGVFNYAKEEDAEVQVDPRKLVQAIKTLKDKLYQDKF